VLDLAGHPLVAYPVAAARASGVCDAVFLTTDDEEIASAGRRYGADVPFLRPPDLAEDLTTTEATLKHALESYEAHTGERFDVCVFITATDVFRQPSWIAEAVRRLEANPALESVFSGHATHKNYWHEAADGGYERILPWMRTYSSRQVRSTIWREDTGLACASRAALWREGRRIGDRVEIIENKLTETAIDIHEAFDLFLAEQAIAWLRAHAPERAPIRPEPVSD
jgi:CMP-N,N'-diacetyllegionaminic acid synthase